MNYEESLKFIESTYKFGEKIGLENITLLLGALGDPHKKLKYVHVAGTNGKGSTCTMLSKVLLESGVPMFAMCQGHQLLALATGADTYKLKYGHRGGNHPVKDLSTGRVYITAQNHGYAVDEASVDKSVAEPAFRNVNDGTNEGLSYFGRPIQTVQFHPEAKPGPTDTAFLFDRFMEMMEAAHA